jgi:hypothetical protein
VAAAGRRDDGGGDNCRRLRENDEPVELPKCATSLLLRRGALEPSLSSSASSECAGTTGWDVCGAATGARMNDEGAAAALEKGAVCAGATVAAAAGAMELRENPELGFKLATTGACLCSAGSYRGYFGRLSNTCW